MKRIDEKELEFASLFKDQNDKEVIFSNQQQDMFEHWDVSVNGVRIDVKGMRKINRYDIQPQNLTNYIELQNVRGNKGWLYGMADYIAFETINKWIMVKRTKLIEFIDKKVQPTFVDKASNSLYKYYQREGRKDIITMVNNIDLVEISTKVLNKNKK